MTGAGGFVGTRVAERLAADGHDVVPFSRRTGGDVTDAAALAEAAQGADAIVHLVAILDGSAERFEAVNAQGPANAVAAATTRSLRATISRERGPGISVRSSTVPPISNTSTPGKTSSDLIRDSL